LASVGAANKEKPLPHKLCNFRSSLRACPASSASMSAFFQYMIWYVPKSEKV